MVREVREAREGQIKRKARSDWAPDDLAGSLGHRPASPGVEWTKLPTGGIDQNAVSRSLQGPVGMF
jgi:hypothetical protein